MGLYRGVQNQVFFKVLYTASVAWQSYAASPNDFLDYKGPLKFPNFGTHGNFLSNAGTVGDWVRMVGFLVFKLVHPLDFETLVVQALITQCCTRRVWDASL